jgi:hypothetical protein
VVEGRVSDTGAFRWDARQGDFAAVDLKIPAHP